MIPLGPTSRALLVALSLATVAHATRAQDPARADSLRGPLVISSAGSIGGAITRLVMEFSAAHRGVRATVATGGSVDGARAAADPESTPDVFVSADDTIISVWLVPRTAGWWARIAYSTLVLAFPDRAQGASEITSANWVDVLLRPGVHGGRGDPAGDPGAYRSILLFELAERYYHRPGLADSLERAVPAIDLGTGGARTQAAMFADGRLDYMAMYRPSAASHGLRWIELPPQVNLGDSAFASGYATARVRLPGRLAGVPDSVEIVGSRIGYGLTVPKGAPHRAVAEAFAAFVVSAHGRAGIQDAGFDVPDRVTFHGPERPPATVAAGARAP